MTEAKAHPVGGAGSGQAAARDRIDAAAFGVVYGTITVIALLMSVHPPIDDPLGLCLALFGTVFAVALAKAFAELCETALVSGDAATRATITEVWGHARTVLLAANGPALAFALAAFCLLPGALAYEIARAASIAVLAFYGARIGWRLRGTWLSACLSGLLVTGIGLLVSGLKYLVH